MRSQVDAYLVTVAVGVLLSLPYLVGHNVAEHPLQVWAQILIATFGDVSRHQSLDGGQCVGGTAFLVFGVNHASAYLVPSARDAPLHILRQCRERSLTALACLAQCLAGLLVYALLLLVQSLLLQFLLQRVHDLQMGQRHLLGGGLLVKHVAQIGAVLRVDFVDQVEPCAVGLHRLLGGLLQQFLGAFQLFLLLRQRVRRCRTLVLAALQRVHLLAQGLGLLLQLGLLPRGFLGFLVGQVVGIHQTAHRALCCFLFLVELVQVFGQFLGGGVSLVHHVPYHFTYCPQGRSYGHEDVDLHRRVKTLPCSGQTFHAEDARFRRSPHIADGARHILHSLASLLASLLGLAQRVDDAAHNVGGALGFLGSFRYGFRHACRSVYYLRGFRCRLYSRRCLSRTVAHIVEGTAYGCRYARQPCLDADYGYDGGVECRVERPTYQVNDDAQGVNHTAQHIVGRWAYPHLLELVLQSLPASGCGFVHTVVLLLYGHVIFVCLVGYTQVLTQHIDILRQSGEHDTGPCTLLIKVAHDVLHTAHAQHLLDVVGVHARILDVLEDGKHGLHAAARFVEHIAQGVRCHADGLGHFKGIPADGGNHTGKSSSGHFRPHS